MHFVRKASRGKPSGWTPPADIEKGQNILIEGKRISKALPISAYFTNEFAPGW